MTRIVFDPKKHQWNPGESKFTMSEKDVKFDTSYEIVNPKTKGIMLFKFAHSTGPEFDPRTRWVYINSDKTVTLEICNDPELTEISRENYIRAKTQRDNPS